MSDVVISSPGTYLTLRRNRLYISRENEILSEIPIETIDRIKIIDNSRISKSVIDGCIERNIDIVFFDRCGRFTAKVNDVSVNRTDILRKQIKLSENESFYIGIAKEIISTKISNQITLLRKKRKTDSDFINKNIEYMLRMKKNIEKCTTIDEIMGYEGAASKEYFAALSNIVPEKFQFKGRNKRPPRDMFNSMLSMSYSLLFSEIYSFVERSGLNPYIGFIHSDKRNHAALASDLMEIWRPVICDHIVMNITNKDMINEADFDKSEKGVYLKSEGRKIVISEFENRMNSIYEYNGTKITLRDIIIKHVRNLIESISSEDYSVYKSFRTR